MDIVDVTFVLKVKTCQRVTVYYPEDVSSAHIYVVSALESLQFKEVALFFVDVIESGPVIHIDVTECGDDESAVGHLQDVLNLVVGEPVVGIEHTKDIRRF